MISIENFNLFVEIWIGIAILIFPITLFITAPYGRHSKKNWGPMIKNSVGWVLMELPALVIFGLIILLKIRNQNIVVLIISAFWIIHYLHRSLIFPFRIKTKNKLMPVIIMLFAILFNSVNAFINAYWLDNFSDYRLEWLVDYRFIIGSVLFISGYVINKFHDKILINLRKNSTNGYQIPYGGLFKYISCPNFLGEMIEWLGFAILAWNIAALAFFIWTIINLLPRALDHHNWYKKQFIDYPKNRKAVIPGIL